MASDLSAPEVAARLGVKIETVYAYVSRGALTARRKSGARRSSFDLEEVEALARRGRPRRSTRPAALDLIVETDLTTIVDFQLYYRGRHAGSLARTSTFEQVAHLLWTGDAAVDVAPWREYQLVGQDLVAPRDRIRAAVVLSSASEPLRADLDPAAVAASAARLIASMVAALPASAELRPARLTLQDGPAIRDSIAGRLWRRLAAGRPVPGLVSALNAALVLLADHELASSTVAARVAASVRADPFSVVLAGLGPMAGPLHGSASALVHQMLADASSSGPEPALTTALESYGHLPGFGHRLYPDGDPRAKLLLEMIHTAAPAGPGLRAAHALIEAAKRHSGAEPNVDFALAALTTVARMPASAGETIFTIARAAGWIAHAVEEYGEVPLRFRARAIRRPSHT